MRYFSLTSRVSVVLLIIPALLFFHEKELIEAHIPFIAKDQHANIQEAFYLENITISKVIYQILSKKSPKSWLKFSAKNGDVLYFQIGIPKISNLKDFRPSVSLSLEDNSDPDNNSQLSSKVISTYKSSSVDEPELFHERFSDTYSWILFEQTVTIEKSGIYYLTSFSENDHFGKLWVAVGKTESFGINDLAKLPTTISEVKKFHADHSQSINAQNSDHIISKKLIYLFVLVSVVTLLGYIFYKRRMRR